MGNIAAIDMGIVVLRCTIFDRKNDLFPHKIAKQKPPNQSFFMSDYSFYSKEHGGTFHFLQFNIMYTSEFLESPELKHLLVFLDKQYNIQKEQAWAFIEQLSIRKSVLDYKHSQDFTEQAIKRNYIGMPVLSTGGYNDNFLRFVSYVLNTEIVKFRDHLQFVIIAIDYLNKHTNDCFFKIKGHTPNDRIQFCGQLNAHEMRPKRQFFSLKDELYPYLLVDIRSGATFTRINSVNDKQRICGTSIGASFFWGALRYLNMYDDPTLALQDAVQGDNCSIDMSVADIYGGDYPQIGLPGSLIASSFGKLKDLNSEQISEVKSKDVSRALIVMTAVNVLIFSTLTAKLQGLKRVVWVGLHVDILEYMNLCAQTFQYLSGDEATLMYPTYHSFLGSLGLLLSHGHFDQEEETDDKVDNLFDKGQDGQLGNV